MDSAVQSASGGVRERAARANTDTPADFSQRAHRRTIGLLGIVLPWLLYALAGVRQTEGLSAWRLLSSVSAYYYTGAVGVFVGVLFALSLFLFTYRGYQGVWADRVVGTVGGTAALVVALFPTRAPENASAPAWWSEAAGVLHYIGAVVLFSAFIVFALWLFRKSDIPKRSDRPRSKRLRDDACLACGLVMIGCMAWAALASLADRSIFWPEAIAILAFAISWLVKGEVHELALDAAKRLKRAA